MSHTNLKGVSDIRLSLLTDTIEESLVDFLAWAFLQAEGYARVDGPSDPYADNHMTPVHKEGVPDGTIWQASHSDWVYELEDELATVYVNGIETAPSYINYPAGQVVFSPPIPTTSLVQCSYSYRWISIYKQDESWFREVVLGDEDSTPLPLLDMRRIYPPLIIIEPVMKRRMRGFQLGSGALSVGQDFLFHILAESSDERNNIADIIALQQDKTFFLYDLNKRRKDGEFALDWRGHPISGAKKYPDIINAYKKQRCRFSKIVGEDVSLRLPLYRGIMRATLEVDGGVF